MDNKKAIAEKKLKITVYLLNLGCAKNQVDGEVMAGALAAAGFTLVEQPQLAQVIIVNTCGFIETAKIESINALLEMAQYKEDGCCRLLVCAGCMSGKYREEMAESMPELDIIIAPGDFSALIPALLAKLNKIVQLPALPANCYLLRRRAAPNYSAYLKIAEGCDNHCAYCLIPQLRGHYCSRPMEDILEEAANLAAEGIKELIVVAQDTTNYGRDIYGKRCLPMLLEKLAQLPIPMIRILYLYPSDVEEDLLQVMAAHDNICNYLDIPIQHGDNVILAAMNRRGTKELFVEKIAMIRRYLPDVMLRTTVIVGFPGETADNFANLLDFLQQARFDWVGAFPYFQEDDTPAAIFDGQVPPEIKQSRLDQVMEQAAQITAEKLAQWPGRMVSVLAEDTAVTADGCYEGRSYGQAPEVDGVIYFSGANVRPGDLVRVRISAAETFDLWGEMI